MSNQYWINEHKKSIQKARKGIDYCEKRIKEKPELWIIKEYKAVIQNNKKEIKQLKRTIERIRKLKN